MSIFKDSVRTEILDGKREWSVSERTAEACDLFEVQVVRPLRELRDKGCIETHEIGAPVPGRYRVVQVMLRNIVRLEDE